LRRLPAVVGGGRRAQRRGRPRRGEGVGPGPRGRHRAGRGRDLRPHLGAGPALHPRRYVPAVSRKPPRDVHEGIVARLRESGQRYTAARRALVEALAAPPGPLSAAELLAAIGDLPQSSVYRNLADLEQAGVVVRVAAGGDVARYELAEALAGHHHHLL